MVASVILAAGEARRMGRPKQALPVGGQPMLRRAVTAALAAGCRPVIVVLGAHAGLLHALLHGTGAEVVENAAWACGMGSSIRAGVTRVVQAAPQSTALLLQLADQPRVDAEVLSRLLTRHATDPHRIVAARYAGTLGVPALFPRTVWPDLLGLPAAAGAKSVLQRGRADLMEVDIPEAALDVDTPEEYASLGEAV